MKLHVFFLNHFFHFGAPYVGSLDAPNQTCSLIAIHLTAVAMLVAVLFCTLDDILRQLEIERENFLLFLTDAARYMSLAGKT